VEHSFSLETALQDPFLDSFSEVIIQVGGIAALNTTVKPHSSFLAQ
jgi:hypothetical protein